MALTSSRGGRHGVEDRIAGGMAEPVIETQYKNK